MGRGNRKDQCISWRSSQPIREKREWLEEEGLAGLCDYYNVVEVPRKVLEFPLGSWDGGMRRISGQREEPRNGQWVNDC